MPYPSPQQVFQMRYEFVRRDELVGVLLAFFLGCFGIHHFYLNRVGLGVLYLCFCWTGIPAILGVIECFFMPGRVRIYNAVQAAGLAAALGIILPGSLGYAGWAGSDWASGGYGYAQSVPGAVPAYSHAVSLEPALTACGNCFQTNSTSSRFCSGCGTRLS